MQGYSYKGDKQVFPVVLGEFGSYLNDPRNGCNARGCMSQELAVRVRHRRHPSGP